MILLKKLTWSNCFSYGENNELILDGDTVTQIIGTNGVGKSSIPLIIEEVLYNKNSKGIKKADIPKRYVDKGYKIGLSFEKDTIKYEINVDRSTKLKVQLLCDGEDISSHTATNTFKTLRDIIGIEFKTFSQLVYQSTNASLQFLSATDTNRKKFLIELLHLENYLLLLEVFKEAHKDFIMKTSGTRAQIDVIEKWLSTNALSDTTPQSMLKIEIDTEDDEKNLRNLTRELDNISEKNEKISKNNNYKDLLERLDISILTSGGHLKHIPHELLQRRVGEQNTAIRYAKEAIKKLGILKDECPTCMQQIDAEFKQTLLVEEHSTIVAAKDWIDQFNIEIEEARKNNEDFKRYTDTQRDWEGLFRSIDTSLQSHLLDKDELSRRVSDVRGKLREAKTRLAEMSKENQKRAGANARIAVIQEQTEAFLHELKGAESFLSEHDLVLSNLEVLKKAFSTNGILAYKIDNLVKDLEELGNTYLAELSDGQFSLEFVVSNDRLNVQITDNGSIVDITALSSGELARVNTAVLIAIRKLMSSISKSRINVLFLDEVIAVLDDVGREKLVELLLKEEKLNTYIVSHQWEHPLLAKINITKEKNISRLEV